MISAVLTTGESLENHMKNDNLLCQMDCFKGVGNDSLNLLWKKGKSSNL